MTLEILIFCHKFQRRLCWVLSSILEQEPHDLDVRVNVSCVSKGNGLPGCQDVSAFFAEKGLRVDLTQYGTLEQIAYPSLLKNDQIRASDADWIMCHSADHVFSPGYFRSVQDNIEKFPDEHRVMGSGNKTHTDAVATDKYMEVFSHGEPFWVNGAYRSAMQLPPFTGKAGRGAGGHFFFRREACMEKLDGYYARLEQCRDRHLFNQFMNTRSDPGFKRRMGGVNKIRLAPLCHLNHARAKEVGHYIDKQN